MTSCFDCSSPRWIMWFLLGHRELFIIGPEEEEEVATRIVVVVVVVVVAVYLFIIALLEWSAARAAISVVL